MSTMSFTANNERFTHLLSLYQLLSNQKSQDIEHFCKNGLCESFRNNHKLLPQILFYGMHHILYKIDFNIIKNMHQHILNNNKNDFDDGRTISIQHETHHITINDIHDDISMLSGLL